MNSCTNCGDGIAPEIKVCRACVKLLRINKVGIFVCAVFAILSTLFMIESAFWGRLPAALISAGIACAATFAGWSFLPSGNKNKRARSQNGNARGKIKERAFFTGFAALCVVAFVLYQEPSLLLGDKFDDVKEQLIADNPAADLQNLTYAGNALHLSRTSVSDISALSELTSLERLYLTSTPVSDISALSGLTTLQLLELSGAPVSDIRPLSGLTNLEWLDLLGTPVSDISALSGLTNLETLDLYGTPVSDVSALGRLTALKRLDLTGTSVTDISALSGLPALERLNLSDTSVSDVSPIEHLINDGLVLIR